MKQTLLLVLALGMFCINMSAQTKKRTPVKKSTTTKPSITKERKVGNDGYIWYRLKIGNLYGAIDIDGNIIVPTQYNDIEYVNHGRGDHYFKVLKGDYYGVYTRLGHIVLSTDKHFTHIEMLVGKGKIAWEVGFNGGRRAALDAKGNEVLPPYYEKIFFNSVYYGEDINRGPFYFIAKQNGKWGIYDLDGNKVLNHKYESDIDCYLYDFDGKGPSNLKEYGEDGNKKRIQIRNKTRYNYTPFDDLYYPFQYTSLSNSSSSTSLSPSSSSTSSSSFSSSSSSSNSGNNTTTIHVEHHHDPVPVQEWRACFACGGMGTMGCDNCGGSGTKYIGDRLHRCSRCNGRGIIPCNVCYGNKGKYVTVYK